MTDEQRIYLPDSIRTNGETPNPWWTNAVVYQIYPRSFQDSNGDGMGDIPGITSRLDYLADLGIDVIWLSPVFKSPQDDNGYDISDYRAIDPVFGNLYDMDDLIAGVHERGMKIIMDLVVNHTSDEHAWFQASRRSIDGYTDWYWWRPPKEGHVPGTPGAEPNNWGSDFGGSAWEFDSDRGEYYLHSFSPKQPDLNWENPNVRQAIFDMMNWWMDRGIDGFRMDVITLISKPVLEDGTLPDGEPGEDGYANSQKVAADGPRLDEFLSQMRREVFDGRDGTLTVGEAPGISPDRDRHITDPANGELDMLFLFRHVEFDENGSKWNPLPLNIVPLKQIMTRAQSAVKDVGWSSLFFNNHDQPRVVSRWGDTSSDDLRRYSAKAIGLILHMHRGTPYVYQGEELGMTNAGFTALDQYRDIESLDLYRVRVLSMHLSTHDQMIDALGRRSRDNARTPMQWDGSRYAGFMSPNGDKHPWLPVNINKQYINVRNDQRNPNSVLTFYKEMIHLRHSDPVVAAGDFTLLDADDQRVYAFTRSIPIIDMPGHADGVSHGSEDVDRIVVIANLTSRTAQIPPETAKTIGLDPSWSIVAEGMIDQDRVLISNYSVDHSATALVTGRLSPWEAFVYRV
ncbi:alpha-glucosidase [Bifidobacterium aquikefiri]|uniref:alpha-glucosidase n=1 Tax=Bifidobacterium aquikefiri TaxID=1653207 RepID=UPI0039E998CD